MAVIPCPCRTQFRGQSNLLRDHERQRGKKPALFPSPVLGLGPIGIIKRVGEEDARPSHLVGMYGGRSSALGAGAMGQASKAISSFLRVFAVCVDPVPLSFFCLSYTAPTVSQGLLDYGMAGCLSGLCHSVRDLSSRAARVSRDGPISTKPARICLSTRPCKSHRRNRKQSPVVVHGSNFGSGACLAGRPSP